jgi:hypothetical protein
VTEHLPEQYQVCLTALDEIIKRAFDIVETSDDNREKLQAMQLFKDTHLVKLELLSNATTIDNALNYIRNKQQAQQPQQRKTLDLDSISDDDNNDSGSGSQLQEHLNIEKKKVDKQYSRPVLNINSMLHERQHRSEAEEWCFRLMNDPEYFPIC